MGRQQTLTDLQQSVELSLQDLPGVSVLCWNLQGEGHALPGETLVQRHQGSVNTGLYQVTGKVLRKMRYTAPELPAAVMFLITLVMLQHTLQVWKLSSSIRTQYYQPPEPNIALGKYPTCT